MKYKKQREKTPILEKHTGNISSKRVLFSYIKDIYLIGNFNIDVKFGNHRELISKGGFYTKLYLNFLIK